MHFEAVFMHLQLSAAFRVLEEHAVLRCFTMIRIVILTLFFFSQRVATAMEIPYVDVPFGAWYVEEVQVFVNEGYLDATQPLFRPADRATRAEFIKLIVALNGGILDELPEKSHFSDVTPKQWFFGVIEEAAREKWVQGDGNCYGKMSCRVRPNDPITRAEAAALIRRAFGKKRLGRAPAFADVPAGSWFADAVQAAADHCVIRGDDGTRNARPNDFVNRAEMVAMLNRIDEGGAYPSCL